MAIMSSYTQSIWWTYTNGQQFWFRDPLHFSSLKNPHLKYKNMFHLFVNEHTILTNCQICSASVLVQFCLFVARWLLRYRKNKQYTIAEATFYVVDLFSLLILVGIE